jgi:DNA-binding transcriptional MerR regulator
VGLVQIGALAREAGVLPSTVRFYVKRGLLSAKTTSPGGFLLFDREEALVRISHIQELQRERRLTLDEIRETLGIIDWG